MGNDGGSIPKRRELVKEAARAQTASEVKETQQEHQEHRWTTCALSQRPLRSPVVSDCAGLLYNKDAILEYLLPPEDPAAEAAKVDAENILRGRVRGLRDIVEVKFQTPETNGDGPSAGAESHLTPWICPVTNKSLGPGVKSVYLVPCGHAFADIAIKEITETVCLQCNETFERSNVITILPTAKEDIARLEERVTNLREHGLTHALKKLSGSKKRKKGGEATTEGEVSSVPNSAPNGKTKVQASKNIRDAATASLTAKVLAEEQEQAKRRKLGLNSNLKTLFKASTARTPSSRNGDFMTRGFDIPAGARHE